MSNQSFLYNTDQSPPSVNTVFNLEKPTLIRSAGLTESVIVYTMVGQCESCRPDDVLWEPLKCCGVPVELNADFNTVYLTIPGKYSLGNPLDGALVLAGDVNITKQSGVDPSLVGKGCACADSPQEVEIVSSCDEPVFVKMCPEDAIQVETALAELGCIVDTDGSIIGKVMLCKMINEETGVETMTITAYFEDGTVTENYTGPWQVCTPDVCQSEPFIGVITDLSILTN